MPDSRLEVTTAAMSPSLLTIQELRTAAGVTDGSEDVSLLALGARVAAKITEACRIAKGEGAEPTLLQETLTETFYDVCTDQIILARRHDIAVTSVTIDGTSIDTADVVVDSEAGLISRRLDGLPYRWSGTEIVVVYQAGFATVPQTLKAAAMELVQWERSRATRDPYAKSISTEIPGVITERADYWVGAVPGDSGGPVPSSVMSQLRRFMNG